MKKSIITKMASVVLAGVILFSSCASATMIQSTPSGATLYMAGENVGVTPYLYEDTKIVGSTTSIKMEKEGYETFNTILSRNEEVDVGAIIGGLFVWIPFLWTMKYKPEHTYELTPGNNNSNNNSQPTISTQENPITSLKVIKLRDLKKLLDENIITQEEFENEKKKILEE